jgi:hypothetical protein
MIAYARPGQRWTFYELDPTVARIAEDPLFFTYLRDALAPYRTVLGDARLSLADERERFDLIVVDAFTSDAVPVHLLTREAIALYRGRLSPDGWIAFHTSNRYADFSPVLAQLAQEIDWLAYEGRDEIGSAPAGRYPSHWILLAASPVTFEDARWRALEATGSRGWTDAHSSIFEVLRR